MRTLHSLRERVDAGHFDNATREELAHHIRELAETRDRLRIHGRPARAGLMFVAGTFGGSGLLLAFLKFQSYAWLAFGVAIFTAAIAAVASEWAQRWLDAVPEYEGLIADLRKKADAARAAGGDAARQAPPSEDIYAMTPSELLKWAEDSSGLLRGFDPERPVFASARQLADGRIVITGVSRDVFPSAVDPSSGSRVTGVRIATGTPQADTISEAVEERTKAPENDKDRGER
ncbi:MAG: hypothetical protein U0326_15175 [Polyangiales bacterium]